MKLYESCLMGHEGQNYLTNLRYELEIVPIQTGMKQISVACMCKSLRIVRKKDLNE